MATDYLLVSVPSQQLDEARLQTQTSQRNLSRNYPFAIPDALRVGTLDELVSLSDDLQKIDSYVYSVALKLSHTMADLLDNNAAKVEEELLADKRTLNAYTEQFEWDSAKYNVKLSIRDLAQGISKHVSGIEHDMKSRVSSYSKTKQNLQAIDRKTNGSLLIRSLGDIVKTEHVVPESEFLVTLLVVVPKHTYKEWERTYETLNEYVVPKSSELISEDPEYGLWTVTIFRKFADDFRNAAREKKFIVREYEFDAEEVEADEEERHKLKQDLSKKYSSLVNWCKVSFSEAFTSWLHIKALRVFVESVLRYGLPPEFTVKAMKYDKGSVKRLRTSLEQLFGHLDKADGSKAETIDIPGLMTAGEYYPYVSFDVNLAPFYPSR